MLYSVWFTLSVLFAASSVTTAWECRSDPDLLDSVRSLQINVGKDGHVWIHVLGLRRRLDVYPPQQTADRTMFASSTDFFRAWNAFVYHYKPRRRFADCSRRRHARSAGDCIPARHLGIRTAYWCNDIDPATGLCDPGTVTPVRSRRLNIAFWYVKKGGHWILNSAYPTTLRNCY